MGYPFTVLISHADESYDSEMNVYEVAPYLARVKAHALLGKIKPNEVLICCDTVVIQNEKILGKPKNHMEAEKTLLGLSEGSHQVMSAVSMYQNGTWKDFHEITLVEFHKLQSEDIDYYIKKFKPLDKAGAYGIQEWIGLIAIKKITGSYTNVIGLPTQKLYQALNEWGVTRS
jgi:septum formation protein